MRLSEVWSASGGMGRGFAGWEDAGLYHMRGVLVASVKLEAVKERGGKAASWSYGCGEYSASARWGPVLCVLRTGRSVQNLWTDIGG